MIVRFFTRLAIVGLLVCFGIFYGIDLATHGIENVHGPLQTESWTPADDKQEEANDSAENDNADVTAAYKQAEMLHDSTLVGSLADATGTMLQRTARGGIEWIVSVFDGILH